MRSARWIVVIVLAIAGAVLLLARRRPPVTPSVPQVASPPPQRPRDRAASDGNAAHRWTAQEDSGATADASWRGLVVDREGLPVDEASVRLCADRACNDVLAQADTDDKGAFDIEWPPRDEADPATPPQQRPAAI